MSTFIELPTPLPSDSIGPGYIITDPFNTSARSSFSLRPAQQPELHITEKSAINQDARGGYETTKLTSQRKDSVMLAADESTTTISIAQPQASFHTLRNNPKTHAFLREAAAQHKPIFYITGVQTVTLPSLLPETSAPAIRLSTHVTSSSTAPRANVRAVELAKVKCRVGSADEPHALGDLEYEWSYHVLEDGAQLSIGLGKRVSAEDLGDREEEGAWMDESWEYSYSNDDDGEGGLGGF